MAPTRKAKLSPNPGHGEARAFKCFVGDCDASFNRQSAFESHVNAHFKSTKATSVSQRKAERQQLQHQNSGQSPSSQSSTKSQTNCHHGGAQVCRNHNHRRKVQKPIRCVDFFHEGIMEHIRHFLQGVSAKSAS